MHRKPGRPHWRVYLASWDRQQEEFNAERERRFDVMFEVLRAQVGTRFTALDLGCGPGSLTLRMLRRFPRSRCVAVDYDPVVLHIGQGALGTMGGRITWVDAQLAGVGWTRRLPRSRFDAALSTTALHWLPAARLSRLYQDLHGLLRPGGLLLNGDVIPWDDDRPLARRVARRINKRRYPEVGGQPRWPGWERWWARAEKDVALRPFFEERERRRARHPREEPASLETHRRALRRAGFREVEVVWQDLENRVLMAIR